MANPMAGSTTMTPSFGPMAKRQENACSFIQSRSILIASKLISRKWDHTKQKQQQLHLFELVAMDDKVFWCNLRLLFIAHCCCCCCISTSAFKCGMWQQVLVAIL